MFWGGSRSTKPCVFRCKVAAGDDERYLVCATGAAAVVPDAIGSFYVFCNKWLFLWCSSMRFLKLWLLIALEWLHECCMGYVFLLKFLLKSASKSSFCRFGVEIRFWSCNFRHLACSSIVFCNSVSADRIVVAASRLLGVAAACVILVSFAAEDRKSYWNGCIKAAKVICQQIFSLLALIIFLLKFLFKSASKSSFCRFGVGIHPVLELQFPTPCV